MGEYVKGNQTLLSTAQWQDKKQWAQPQTQEILSEHKKTVFDCEGSQTLEQVALRGCGLLTLGDIKNLAGHGPGQLSLGEPCLRREVGLDLKESLPN